MNQLDAHQVPGFSQVKPHQQVDSSSITVFNLMSITLTKKSRIPSDVGNHTVEADPLLQSRFVGQSGDWTVFEENSKALGSSFPSGCFDKDDIHPPQASSVHTYPYIMDDGGFAGISSFDLDSEHNLLDSDADINSLMASFNKPYASSSVAYPAPNFRVALPKENNAHICIQCGDSFSGRQYLKFVDLSFSRHRLIPDKPPHGHA